MSLHYNFFITKEISNQFPTGQVEPSLWQPVHSQETHRNSALFAGLVQLLLVLTTLFAVGYFAHDHATLAVVVVAAACPIVSSPLGVGLSIRHRKSGGGGTLSIFWAPTYPTLRRIFAPVLHQEASSIVKSLIGRLRVPDISAEREQ